MSKEKEGEMALILDVYQTKYLVFVKKQFLKKKTYNVTILNKSNEYLGDIYWRTGWRTYVINIQPEIDLDIKCWDDISEYVKLLLQERLDKKSNKA